MSAVNEPVNGPGLRQVEASKYHKQPQGLSLFKIKTVAIFNAMHGAVYDSGFIIVHVMIISSIPHEVYCRDIRESQRARRR